MAYEHILYDVADRVATVTLNRPDRLNAWTRLMEREARAALEAATRDDGVRVVVLTGAGRGFCAGADMALLGGIRDGRGDEQAPPSGPMPGGLDLPGDFGLRYTYFPTVPKPIVAAVNGPCAGLGMVMALWCDLRFAAEDAMFTAAFSRRGLIAEHGLSWTLPRLVGPAHALDLLLSSRKVGAREAQGMGLVNRVHPAGDLMPKTLAYARELAEQVSPRSMRVMKGQVWRGLTQSLGDAVETANREMAGSFASEDFREGVAHFVEKRAPRFTGR